MLDSVLDQVPKNLTQQVSAEDRAIRSGYVIYSYPSPFLKRSDRFDRPFDRGIGIDNDTTRFISFQGLELPDHLDEIGDGPLGL